METKWIIFHEKFSSLGQKMDFYLTTSASTFPCSQITWQCKVRCHSDTSFPMFCVFPYSYHYETWPKKSISVLLFRIMSMYDFYAVTCLNTLKMNKLMNHFSRKSIRFIYDAISSNRERVGNFRIFWGPLPNLRTTLTLSIKIKQRVLICIKFKLFRKSAMLRNSKHCCHIERDAQCP